MQTVTDRRKIVPYLLTVTFAIVSLVMVQYCYAPHCDEIGTADAPINFLIKGKWYSHVWTYTYNPLHAFLLIGWIKIFGISHLSVCGMNVFISLITSFVLMHIIGRRTIITSFIQTISFLLAYWALCNFDFGFHFGRIDYLVMLFSILLADEILKPEQETKSSMVFLWTFLLIGAGIYSVPVLVIFLIGKFFIRKNERRTTFRQMLLVCAASLVCIILICTFYYSLGYMMSFVHTYFSFSGTLNQSEGTFIERLGHSYEQEKFQLIIYIILIIYAFIRRYKINISRTIFIMLIPAIMTVAGRYQFYYRWLCDIPILLNIIWIYKNNTTIKVIFCSVIFLFALISGINQIQSDDTIDRYMNSKQSLLGNYHNFVFTDAGFYYYLVGQENELTYNGNGDFSQYQVYGSREDKAKEERVKVFVSKIFKKNEVSNTISKFIFTQLIQGEKTLPDNFIMLNSTNDIREEVIDSMPSEYDCKLIDEFCCVYYISNSSLIL